MTGNLKRLGVPLSRWTGRRGWLCYTAKCTPATGSRSASPGRTSPKPGLAQRTISRRTASTSGRPGHSASANTGARRPYLQILASELSDKLLAEILELDAEMTVTMHIQTVDQLKAIKTIKGKLSDIGKMKVEEQRKAVRAGYDPDILPPDLITFSKDAAELLADLQSRNERDVPAHVHGHQYRPHPAAVGKRCVYGGRYRAEI